MYDRTNSTKEWFLLKSLLTSIPNGGSEQNLRFLKNSFPVIYQLQWKVSYIL